MEPPAKRMRIHQSVRVDGENLDYVGEEQKNQQRLKSQFESIFEKLATYTNPRATKST